MANDNETAEEAMERVGLTPFKPCVYCSGSGHVSINAPGRRVNCPVCGGRGLQATVEQFENAYKRH